MLTALYRGQSFGASPQGKQPKCRLVPIQLSATTSTSAATPGTTIAVLKATPQGLKEVRKVQVPEAGRCLGAEGPYYWTCDAKDGRLLVFKGG